MRPIETQYNGVTFRSRLEARWAVFFDAVKYDWEYEPRTAIYTPDFLLTTFNLYAEVKPKGITRLEIRKARALARLKPVLMLIEWPDFKPYWMLREVDEIQVVLLEHWIKREFKDEWNSKLFPPESFPESYQRAVDMARRYRFDGYDADRDKISRRYA